MQTHQRLLEEGTRLFGEKGISRTKAADVAQAASVAVGTLYLHFGDKDGLLREILIVGIGKLRSSLRILGEEKHLPFPELLQRHLDVLTSFVLHHQELARVMFHPEVTHCPMGADVLGFMIFTMENLLREGISLGLVREDLESTVAARALVGMTLHILHWWAEDPTRCGRNDIIQTLLRFHLAVGIGD